MVDGIHTLNREMVAAGVRRFAGGLGPAHPLKTQPNGEVVVTDGPYLETKELVGGIRSTRAAGGRGLPRDWPPWTPSPRTRGDAALDGSVTLPPHRCFYLSGVPSDHCATGTAKVV